MSGSLSLMTAQALFEEGQWEHPNYAPNRIYKLIIALGQDTSGLLDF